MNCWGDGSPGLLLSFIGARATCGPVSSFLFLESFGFLLLVFSCSIFLDASLRSLIRIIVFSPYAVNLDLPPGFTSEFKLVHIIPGQAPIWEYTPNRQLSIPATASPVTASLALAWCEPSFAESTLPAVEETGEPVVEESSSIQSAVAESGLVTPPFMSSVTSFFNGNSTAQTDKKTEKTEKDVAALEAAFVADPAVKETEENIEEVESPIIEESAAEPAVAETEAVLTAEPATEEDSVITELVETESSSTKMLKSAAKTAGAVALGVAGAALLSALAVDVADTAIIGAMAVAAGSAALGGSSSKTKKSTTSSLEDGEKAEEGEEGVVVEEEERKITGAGETGVIIAAGLLSAYDATKAMVDSVSKKSVASSEDEAASEE